MWRTHLTMALSFSDSVLRELPDELSDFSGMRRSRLARLEAMVCLSREACFSRELLRWRAESC